jgi:hypothetical protein
VIGSSLIKFIAFLLAAAPLAQALERPGVEFKIFQFPPDQIPRIDGNTDDWAMVSKDYIIGIDQLSDTVRGHGTNYNRTNLDVQVRVGWVKSLNQLYFLYEASDDYWDFARTDLHNDIFEVVVDGDIKQMHPHFKDRPEEAHFSFHGVHAQNYHIFTPAEGKDWAMVWGCQPWIKELPYANAAQRYSFRPGQSGIRARRRSGAPGHVPAQGKCHHRSVMGGARLRRRKGAELQSVLESLAQNDDVRQRV